MPCMCVNMAPLFAYAYGHKLITFEVRMFVKENVLKLKAEEKSAQRTPNHIRK